MRRNTFLPSAPAVMPAARILLGLLLLSLLGGCSLAGDVTPPADYQQKYAARETAQAPALPMEAPNPQLGAQLYDHYCAQCHGATGLGDGPSASGLQVPDLVKGDLLWTERPTVLYQVITQGKGSMPAFSEMLTSGERWEVIAYLYGLDLTPEQVARGQAVYQQQCQACHGESGQGNGSAPDWTDLQYLAAASNADLVQAISTGHSPEMAFSQTLSAEDAQAAAAYLRASIFSSSDEPQTDTPEAVGGGTITGKVFNITNGSSTGGLSVVLLGLDSSSGDLVDSRPGTVAASGIYLFDKVQPLENRTYVVSVTYQGVPYYSSSVEARELLNDQTVNRPVEVYEASRDVSRLSVERRHIFLDFTTDGNLQVMEMLLINNPLKVAVVGGSETDPVLTIHLPAGASNLQFDDTTGQRFAPVTGGFVDFLPVQPGAVDQIVFSYELPYPGKLNLSLPVDLPVSQALVILPVGNLKVSGEQLTSLGQQSINAVTAELFSATDLPAGSTLNLEVSGRLARSLSMRAGSSTDLGIGLLIFGAVMAAALYIFYRQRRAEELAQAARPSQPAEELMDAIIALDERYQAGELSEDSYQARRAELKERLRAQVGAGQGKPAA